MAAPNDPPTEPLTILEFRSCLLSFAPLLLDFADKWVKERGFTNALLRNGSDGCFKLEAQPPSRNPQL